MKEVMNKWSRFCLNRSFGLVLIRIATGMVFLMHGWMKIHNVPMVEGMMTSFGLPLGTGFFIAWLEVIGGIALILGLATRVFAVLFGVEMLVAIYLTSFGHGWAYKQHELELILMLLSFGIALTGSGTYSLYKAECDACGGILCDMHKK